MPRKSKVKTGCRTCKIRKVKCDEGRPECRRCVSTGRTCDGYGIWGGGSAKSATSSEASADRSNRSSSPYYHDPRNALVYGCPTPQTSLVYGATISADERPLFEWFVHKTARKLPGAFPSTFWDTLILQATAAEPAVLHAVLALGAQHRDFVWHPIIPGQINITDDGGRFATSQYSKAIRHLQPHFASTAHNDKDAIRVALFACLIFITLENLRGDYYRSRTHLLSGLKLLRLLQDQPIRSHDGCGGDKNSGTAALSYLATRNSADEWINESFTRFSVQYELLCGSLGSPWRPPLTPLGISKSTGCLPGPLQARFQLDRVVNEIGHLTDLCHEEEPEHIINQDLSSQSSMWTRLLEGQRSLQQQLDDWDTKYSSIMEFYQSRPFSYETVAIQILGFYHAMVKIRVETFVHECFPATSRGGEMVFDSHNAGFLKIIGEAINFRQISATIRDKLDPIPLTADPRARSVADIGWLPALYFIAVKCRVSRLRRHAVRLMQSTPHKEGMWDSKLAAIAAEKVVDLEEGDYFRDLAVAAAANATDGSTPEELLAPAPLWAPPAQRDLWVWPPLPVARRLRSARVELPDDNMGIMKIRAQQMNPGGTWSEIVREYDLPSSSWDM